MTKKHPLVDSRSAALIFVANANNKREVQRTGNIILPVRCTFEHIIATISTNITAPLGLAFQKG